MQAGFLRGSFLPALQPSLLPATCFFIFGLGADPWRAGFVILANHVGMHARLPQPEEVLVDSGAP